MPRALVELRSVLPHLELIPYPVVSDRLRNSDWRSDTHVARLLAVEYVKFLAAVVRTKILPPPTVGSDNLMTATRLSERFFVVPRLANPAR
jgi:hypothetical protein